MSSSTAPGEVRAGEDGYRERRRLAVGVAGLIALQLIAHCAALAGAGGGLTVVTPLVLPGALAAWASFSRHPLLGLATLAVLAALAGVCLLSATAAHWLPLGCQLSICLALTWLFGHTLLPGATPLVTQMSRAVHGTLPPLIETYTRQVTLAWTLFLAALGILSLLLFLVAPMRVWSLFANLLLLPLVAAMFLTEYAYRSLRYGWFPHATLTQSVMAFQRLRGVRAAALARRRE
jgi:uncharacterized membrane protein